MITDKFCKDCKHLRLDVPFFWVARFARCTAPELGLDPVNGKPEWLHACLSREFSSKCGNEARWFEPK